jgi:hypothetical protein
MPPIVRWRLLLLLLLLAMLLLYAAGSAVKKALMTPVHKERKVVLRLVQQGC